MFLIQIGKNQYVNGEFIESVTFEDGGSSVFFTTNNDQRVKIVVEEYVGTFLNNLQAINSNVNIESAYYHQLKCKKVEE